MKLNQLIKRGIVHAIDDYRPGRLVRFMYGAPGGGGGGDGVVSDPPPAGDPLEDEGFDDDLSDLEEEPPPGDPPPADPPPAAAAPETDWKPAAEAAGWKAPEVPAAPPDAAPKVLTPWEQANAEAEATGQHANLEWVIQRSQEIQQERFDREMLRSTIPSLLPGVEADLEKRGLPKEAAGFYIQTAIGLGPDGLTNPDKSNIALALALGMLQLQAPAADPPPAAQPPGEDMPRGPRASNPAAANLSGGEREYLRVWEKTFNHGRPATPDQVADLKKRGQLSD